MSGKHTGKDFWGFTASGKYVTFQGISISRFTENGDLCEIHSFFDRQSVIEQLSEKK